jgi:hypothetical protein
LLCVSSDSGLIDSQISPSTKVGLTFSGKVSEVIQRRNPAWVRARRGNGGGRRSR